jgi:ABC-type oligopeptide transport system ATPase subunit
MNPLLDVRHLVKEYPREQGLFRRGGTIRAVDDVSFAIDRGETFGLVGESGSGKTTTGRCVLRLIEPTSGEVRIDGTDWGSLSSGQLRTARRHAQMVFQDPHSSLDPRRSIASSIEEPLIIHRTGDTTARRARVAELLSWVGLDPADGPKRPSEFSGGQRQRIAVARAIALNPALVICDEPVSALDVSVQAQVVNLLLDLQQRLGLTYLFIAHDLRLMRQICTRIAVMYRGRIVEIATAERLFTAPAHDYTKALLSAIPALVPGQRLERIPFDASRYQPHPLREIATRHFAAI